MMELVRERNVSIKEYERGCKVRKKYKYKQKLTIYWIQNFILTLDKIKNALNEKTMKIDFFFSQRFKTYFYNN